MLAVGASALLVGLNLNTVSIAFADMKNGSFQSASFSSLSWVLSTYTIFFGATLVAGGRIADRLGRRRVFLYGLVVLTAASVVIALSPWLWLVIAGRAAQGVGAAAVVPSSLGLIIDATPIERRPRATAFFSSLSSVGGALGPTVGATTVKLYNWRLAFVLSATVAAIAWYVGRRSLPPSAHNDQASFPDLAGATIIVAMLSALSLGIVQGRSWGWSSGRVVGAFAVAALTVPVFIARSARHASPILPLRLFRLRSFCVANAAALVFGVATGANLFSSVQFLNVVWRYSVFEAGLGLLPMSISAALLAPVAGRLGTRFGERAVGAPGMLVLTLGTLLLRLRLGLDVEFFQSWLPASALIGAGLALTYPMIAAASVRAVAAGDLSVASASNRTALQIGNAIGIALVVAILGDPRGPDALPGFHTAWVVLTAAGLLTAALVAAVGRSGGQSDLRKES